MTPRIPDLTVNEALEFLSSRISPECMELITDLDLVPFRINPPGSPSICPSDASTVLEKGLQDAWFDHRDSVIDSCRAEYESSLSGFNPRLELFHFYRSNSRNKLGKNVSSSCVGSLFEC